jgi:uncharacterized protein YceK
MNNRVIIIGLLSVLLLSGCARFRNNVAANGGFFTSHNGEYIVRNDSGGKIMDVWILHDSMVQEVEGGAGWLFRDNKGNPIHLGGDVKVIRIVSDNEDNSVMTKYHEYHAEFESKTYQELYAKENK